MEGPEELGLYVYADKCSGYFYYCILHYYYYYYYHYYYYSIIVSFMQGIHTHIPETNHVTRGYIVAAILSLLFIVPLCLVPALVLFSFTLALSEVCVQCPIWLFSVVP